MGFDSNKRHAQPPCSSSAHPTGTRVSAQRAALALMVEDVEEGATDPGPAPPPNQTYDLLGNLPARPSVGLGTRLQEKNGAFLPRRWTTDIPAPEKTPLLSTGMGFHLGQSQGFLPVSSCFRVNCPDGHPLVIVPLQLLV